MAVLLKQLGEWLSQALDPAEREAVLGDLDESRSNGWAGLVGIAGLVARREWKGWMHWRPWAILLSLVPIVASVGSIGLADSLRYLPYIWRKQLAFMALSAGVSWLAGYILARTACRRVAWSALLILLVIAAANGASTDMRLSHHLSSLPIAFNVGARFAFCLIPLALGTLQSKRGLKLRMPGSVAFVAAAMLALVIMDISAVLIHPWQYALFAGENWPLFYILWDAQRETPFEAKSSGSRQTAFGGSKWQAR